MEVNSIPIQRTQCTDKFHFFLNLREDTFWRMEDHRLSPRDDAFSFQSVTLANKYCNHFMDSINYNILNTFDILLRNVKLNKFELKKLEQPFKNWFCDCDVTRWI